MKLNERYQDRGLRLVLVSADFDDQIGVGEADAIALCGAAEIGVGAARNFQAHLFCSAPPASPAN
jgi:hypothetical protein